MDEAAVRALLKDQSDAIHAELHTQLAALHVELQEIKGLGLTQHGAGGGDPGLSRSMRLEVPKFNGIDPEWDAAEWFRWMLCNKLITDCDEFLESVRNRSKTVVAAELLVSKPTTLEDAFSLARVTEARFKDQGMAPPDVVEQMQLPVTTTKPFKFYIDSGETLLCENRCSKLLLKMHGLSMEVDLCVLPMKGSDAVLDKTYTLQGDASLRVKQMCLHHMQALLETDEVYGVYELHSVVVQDEDIESTQVQARAAHPEIEQLLARFEALFQDHQFYVKRSAYATTIVNWPVPKVQRHVRSFLGTVEATDLEALKHQLSHALILVLPNFDETFIVETDALATYIEVVLLQKGQPFSFFSQFHNKPSAGHGGIKKMLAGLSALFFWKRMRKSVKEYEDVSMDFIIGLPVFKRFTVIFVVVNRFSKYAHFGTLPTCFNAHKLAELFVEMVVKHHGFPCTVTDGQTEVVNCGLKRYLCVMVSNRPQQWVKFLSWAEYCYNTSYHNSIKMSPFQALYVRLPLAMIPYPPGSSKVVAFDEVLSERDELLQQLRHNLLDTKNCMEMKANSSRRDVEFKQEDLVFVKLQPYRQLTLAKRLSNKLAKRYYGPFKVLERVRKVAYCLALPSTSKIHLVFHVSLLKPFEGTELREVSNFPEDVFEGYPMEQPLSICDSWVVLKNGLPARQVLVQWLGSLPEEATWEWLTDFQAAYPTYHLVDKVISEEKGNVTSTLEGIGRARAKRVTYVPAWHTDYLIG
nr:Ty3/gypsy retrotransposon protein [Tanacetum cinerariifolium]